VIYYRPPKKLSSTTGHATAEPPQSFRSPAETPSRAESDSKTEFQLGDAAEPFPVFPDGATDQTNPPGHRRKEATTPSSFPHKAQGLSGFSFVLADTKKQKSSYYFSKRPSLLEPRLRRRWSTAKPHLFQTKANERLPSRQSTCIVAASAG
jgi:hypothetical protein